MRNATSSCRIAQGSDLADALRIHVNVYQARNRTGRAPQAPRQAPQRRARHGAWKGRAGRTVINRRATRHPDLILCRPLLS